MRNDAFTEGVEPGGLWNKNEIRVLLCYILASVNAPLSREDLSHIIQEKSLANYFEVGDALANLEGIGNVEKDPSGGYTVTPTGREIAQNLDVTLPLSVRDKALEAALSLLADARTRRENRVTIQETDKGFQVTCHISGGNLDLMKISLYAPDRAQAELIRKNFHRDPAGIYKLLLSALTGDNTFLKSFLEKR